MAKADVIELPTRSTHTPRQLRLCSYNIQTGVDSRRYHQYLTQSWKHVLPSSRREQNLDRISDVLRPCDLVGLQEVDAGSLRSLFQDQTARLAQQGGFAWWYSQTNRKVGRIARHSNGLLSRMKPNRLREHRLPGLPGRGAISARFGDPEHGLLLVIMHLALSRRARMRQLDFIAGLVDGHPHCVVMGDLNCQPGGPELQQLERATGLYDPAPELATFPSWRPARRLDHILISPALQATDARVPFYPFSDHLPVMLTLDLPDSLSLPLPDQVSPLHFPAPVRAASQTQST